MARIIITLSTEDIGNLLLGGEFNITRAFRNSIT